MRGFKGGGGGARLPNTPKMNSWLSHSGMLAPSKFKFGGSRPKSGLGTGIRSRTPTVRMRKGTAGLSPYVRSMHAGSTQTTGMVRQHGLVWGKQVFHTRSEFSRSLAKRGVSLQSFAKKHKAAYNGLSTSFTKSKLSR
jgi:hypothetical protein